MQRDRQMRELGIEHRHRETECQRQREIRREKSQTDRRKEEEEGQREGVRGHRVTVQQRQTDGERDTDSHIYARGDKRNTWLPSRVGKVRAALALDPFLLRVALQLISTCQGSYSIPSLLSLPALLPGGLALWAPSPPCSASRQALCR